MREILGTLNDELERDWGARLQVRIGINTGEVVAGDPSAGETFVTGDTVNVAARLEQTAEPGEIVIGAGDVPRWSGTPSRSSPSSRSSSRARRTRSPRSGSST